jgi:hypothetical protein
MSEYLSLNRKLIFICWKYRRGFSVGSAFLTAAILSGINLVSRHELSTLIDLSSWLWVLFLGALIAIILNLLNN